MRSHGVPVPATVTHRPSAYSFYVECVAVIPSIVHAYDLIAFLSLQPTMWHTVKRYMPCLWCERTKTSGTSTARHSTSGSDFGHHIERNKYGWMFFFLFLVRLSFPSTIQLLIWTQCTKSIKKIGRQFDTQVDCKTLQHVWPYRMPIIWPEGRSKSQWNTIQATDELRDKSQIIGQLLRIGTMKWRDEGKQHHEKKTGVVEQWMTSQMARYFVGTILFFST